MMMLALVPFVVAPLSANDAYDSSSPPAESSPSGDMKDAPADHSAPSVPAEEQPGDLKDAPADIPAEKSWDHNKDLPASDSSMRDVPADKAGSGKYGKVAAKHNVAETDVQSLRDKGLGFGEIGLAVAIAERSGQPLSAVVQERDSGLGWGDIAQKYGFKLGDVQKKGKDIEKEFKKADKASDSGMMDKGSRPEPAPQSAPMSDPGTGTPDAMPRSTP